MKILLLHDEKPGHYNQSEGVVAALGRLGPLSVARIAVPGGGVLPARMIRRMIGRVPLGLLERLARVYRLRPKEAPDLIVSAGGETLIPNVLLARRLGVPNIFSGSVRGIAPSNFAAILHIDPTLEGIPPYIIGLKPSPIDPGDRDRPAQPIRRVAAMIGGPTDAHLFTDGEIERFSRALGASSLAWSIASSRRTPESWNAIFTGVAERNDRVTFRDFSTEGPGGIDALLDGADMAVVTDDSVSMISEGIARRMPTVSLEPERMIKPLADQAYLDLLRQRRWCVSLTVARFDDKALLDAAARCDPMRENHLDILAENLRNALPGLF